MNTEPTEFHIWIEQCEATETIRERFGLQNALDYLIGEKLFYFVAAAEQHPEFAAELQPVFHGGNTGSNPVGDAKSSHRLATNSPFFRRRKKAQL
jgi:hypothetical protein